MGLQKYVTKCKNDLPEVCLTHLWGQFSMCECVGGGEKANRDYGVISDELGHWSLKLHDAQQGS